MTLRTLPILAALIAAGAAQAQTRTFHFSDVVTGTSVTASGTNPDYSTTVIGTVVLNGSGAAETLTYNFGITDPAVQFGLSNTETLALGDGGGNGQAALGWLAPLTNAHGAVTGFETLLTLNNQPYSYNGYSDTLAIGPTGVTLSWLASVGDCSNWINCTINASSTSPGTWTAVTTPELEVSRAIAAITLLLGSIAIIKARRWPLP